MFLSIQALLVGVTVVLLRPQTAGLAGRVLGKEVGRGDLRVMAGACAAAAVLVVVGVAVLNSPLRTAVVVVVSALAAAGAVGLARKLDRPEVQAALVERFTARLEQAQRAGRTTGETAGRLGRDVTSRARRGGGGPAGPRR